MLMAVTSLTASSSSNVWELHGRREMSLYEMKVLRDRGEWQLHFFLLFHKPVVSNEGWYNLTFHSRHTGFERRQEMEPEVDKGHGMAFRVTFLFKCKLSPRTDQNSVGDFYIAFSYIVNLRTLQNIIDVHAITVIHLTICNFAFLFYLLSISYMTDNFLFLFCKVVKHNM